MLDQSESYHCAPCVVAAHPARSVTLAFAVGLAPMRCLRVIAVALALACRQCRNGHYIWIMRVCCCSADVVDDVAYCTVRLDAMCFEVAMILHADACNSDIHLVVKTCVVP